MPSAEHGRDQGAGSRDSLQVCGQKRKAAAGGYLEASTASAHWRHKVDQDEHPLPPPMSLDATVTLDDADDHHRP